MARLMTPGPTGRRRWLALWQLPVLVLSLLLGAGLALLAPDLFATPGVLGGGAAILLVSVAAWWLPDRWLLLVPSTDILAVGFIRSELVTELPSVSSLALIPIICLAFHFDRTGLGLAVPGALLVTGLPFLLDGRLPHGVGWLTFLALPAVSIMLAVMAQRGAGILASRSNRLRDALALSEERLAMKRGIIDAIPAGVVYHRRDGERVLANQRAFEFALLAGMDPDHPERPATSVWREDRIRRVPPAEQFVARALAGDEIDAELVWLGEPGQQVAVAVSAHQVRADDGTRLGTVVVSLDVTELVESVRVRDQFLATLSHELRTPLVSVVGYLDIIADELGDGDPEIVEMLDTARRSAHTLTDRISHLLVAGSQDRLTLDLDRVDLSALVSSVADRYRPAAATRGVALRYSLAPLSTTADPHKIDLVVDNLVSNALKHTASGGTVAVELRAADGIELVVSDTGAGLDRHESQRAFDRFYRTESARRDAVQGLGLGLSICKAVVEAHGGDISMESAPGQGTTVTVHLPRRLG
jgi:signal transduction histidine kinase